MPATSGTGPNGLNKFLHNMGFATGVAILYKISPTLSVKGGLQFNYSRFAISAVPGAIAGSSRQAPISNPGGPQDSLGLAAGAAAPGGQSAQTLYNEYFQLSAPVGLELRVWGNDRLQVNVAATVQPAYMLNTNAWLLSAEGNNYTQSPSMFRKWNVDGGAEVYVSYKIGGFHLQVGPDFRYQFLSKLCQAIPRSRKSRFLRSEDRYHQSYPLTLPLFLTNRELCLKTIIFPPLRGV